MRQQKSDFALLTLTLARTFTDNGKRYDLDDVLAKFGFDLDMIDDDLK
jgi:hypothetical protein